MCKQLRLAAWNVSDLCKQKDLLACNIVAVQESWEKEDSKTVDVSGLVSLVLVK